jgi:cytochrome c553
MEYRRSALALVVALCGAMAPLLASAQDLAVRNCNWCHGTTGQGYAPAPRLAGQRAEYIWKQLASFHKHLRDSPFARQYMWGAADYLSPHTAHRLAAYYATLYPRAANDGVTALVASGRTIYQQGMPDANIVACVACHGPNGEGVGAIPRLGGLSYAYLKRRLQQWGEGYNAAAGPPMPHIATTLSDDQIAALASYLSFLK